MKYTALGALALACVLLLAGCGGQESSSSSGSTESSSIDSSAAASNDSVVSSVISVILDDEEITERILVTQNDVKTYILSGKQLLVGGAKEIELDIDGDGVAEYFRMGLDKPNGTRVTASYGGRGQNLASSLTLASAFDEIGDIRESYYMQLSFFDLDADGRLDVMLSVGDLTSESETAVFHFDGGQFAYVGSLLSGAQLRFDNENFGDSDDVYYKFQDGRLYRLGPDGALEPITAEVSDEALRDAVTSLIQPLVIVLADDFDDPAALPAETLLHCGIFGYIVNSNPDTRQYDDTHVLITPDAVDQQLMALFGGKASVDPNDFTAQEDAFVFYDPAENVYKMAIYGYYSDLVRLDKLESDGAGNYTATCSLIPYSGEERTDLTGLDASRVVEYRLSTNGDGMLYVTGLHNLEIRDGGE